MKREKNFTSMLGLAVEVVAVIIMAAFYFTGNTIPRPVYYLFFGGFMITAAGAVLFLFKKK